MILLKVNVVSCFLRSISGFTSGYGRRSANGRMENQEQEPEPEPEPEPEYFSYKFFLVKKCATLNTVFNMLSYFFACNKH